VIVDLGTNDALQARTQSRLAKRRLAASQARRPRHRKTDSGDRERKFRARPRSTQVERRQQISNRENTNPEWARERLHTLTIIEDGTVPRDDLTDDPEINEAIVVDPAVQSTQMPEKQQRKGDNHPLRSDVKRGRADWCRFDPRLSRRVGVPDVGHALDLAGNRGTISLHRRTITHEALCPSRIAMRDLLVVRSGPDDARCVVHPRW
jgi:hypothetical protein